MRVLISGERKLQTPVPSDNILVNPYLHILSGYRPCTIVFFILHRTGFIKFSDKFHHLLVLNILVRILGNFFNAREISYFVYYTCVNILICITCSNNLFATKRVINRMMINKIALPTNITILLSKQIKTIYSYTTFPETLN